MASQALPRVIAAGAVLLAAGLVLLARGPTDAPLGGGILDPNEPLPRAAPAVTARIADAPTTGATAAERLREVQAMSETFRNSTFLIAIRDAGFVCRELLRVYGGVNDSATWTASCSEMLAYSVSIGSSGALHVEPTMQYWDGVGPATLPRRGGEQRLEPQLLLPPETR